MKQEICYLQWETPGHYGEYTMTVQPDKFTAAQELPDIWEQQLEKMLGAEWDVMNRGSRIEIRPPNLTRTPETDSQVQTAILLLIGQGYEFLAIN